METATVGVVEAVAAGATVVNGAACTDAGAESASCGVVCVLAVVMALSCAPPLFWAEAETWEAF